MLTVADGYVYMKRELEYFKIEESYGGNQSWFKDPFMNMGGCAAATACDSVIHFAMHAGKEHLYPYDIRNLKKEDYIRFSDVMKSYLHPRFTGVNKLDLFTEGFGKYLNSVGETEIKVGEYSGNQPYEEAKVTLKKQIDGSLPIPFLTLRHKNPKMKELVWHWYLIIGYEEFENNFFAKIVTYGDYQWIPFSDLWNTGYKEKGGMIILS